MIIYLKGDIFNSPAQVLVNTVNTVGVMGKGIALDFKQRYPEMFKVYEKVCNDKLLDIGNLLLWRGPEKWVLMFPTKKHWRNSSKIEYIEEGLKKFVATYSDKGITSIAFPRLGCGNGNLNWEEVRPLMERYLKKLPIQIYIYVGNYGDQVPEHIAPLPMEEWLHANPERIGFAVLLEDIEKSFKTPAELTMKSGEKIFVEWENNAFLINREESILISSEEICNFWLYIRDIGVISVKELPEQYAAHAEILLAILQHIGYLQPVLTSSDGKTFDAGYQYIRA